MKREIKFRGKRVDNGEWVYGFIVRIQNDDSSYDYMIKEDTTRHISNVTQTIWDVIPESVGQFTGLKDKNGKEIYEGDIMDAGLDIVVVVSVYFKDGGFWYKPNDDSINIPFAGHSALNNILSRFSVIGNIHQNKELLK